MAKQTKTILKGYFETGDVPNQNQYGELVDSQLNLEETDLQTMKSPLSASFFYASDSLVATGSILSKGNIILDNNKTVQGKNASGTVRDISKVNTNDDIILANTVRPTYLYGSGITISSGADIALNAEGNDVVFQDGGVTSIWMNTSAGNITSSNNLVTNNLVVRGNISASSHISASDAWFGGGATASLHTSASLSEIIFENLPTIEPSVSGALWLSGSGAGAASGSKYLMVFNG